MNKTITARILRVNHGGEHGAIRIYVAQIAVAQWRCPDLLPFLRETLSHEREHLAAFRALMPSRAAKPCRMMWIWSVGGALLGFLTALLGREGVLICTEAVERTVHHHLDDQLRYLAPLDPELAQVVRDIQKQELGHMEFAAAHRRTTSSAASAIHSVVSTLTDGLIWISTRGDSARLGKELAA